MTLVKITITQLSIDVWFRYKRAISVLQNQPEILVENQNILHC